MIYLLPAIPLALAAFWLVRVVRTLRALSARQRFVLAGSSTPPLFPSSRRPAVRPVPLRVGPGRAAERVGGVA